MPLVATQADKKKKNTEKDIFKKSQRKSHFTFKGAKIKKLKCHHYYGRQKTMEYL